MSTLPSRSMRRRSSIFFSSSLMDLSNSMVPSEQPGVAHPQQARNFGPRPHPGQVPEFHAQADGVEKEAPAGVETPAQGRVDLVGLCEEAQLAEGGGHGPEAA